MKRKKRAEMRISKSLRVIASLICLSIVFMGAALNAQAANPIRIVVAPIFTEEGTDVRDGGSRTEHYRRVMRYINNKLVQAGFEVVNPTAVEYKEEEYNRMMERAREDSVLASRALCKKYGTDAAYVVWLKVKTERIKEKDGRTLYKGRAILEGEGYDSKGMDLGAGLAKSWTITKDDYDQMLVDVEKEVGYEVGRVLTAWDGRTTHQPSSSSKVVVATTSSAPTGGGILARNIRKSESFVNILLDGATEYQIAEVFGKVVNTTTGVVAAKRYGSTIVTGNPQASRSSWRVEIEDTDAFRLQANIMKMIDDVYTSGGELVMNGVPYRYTANEIEMLRAIRPAQASSMEVQFMVDRELARNADFTQGNSTTKNGFE